MQLDLFAPPPVKETKPKIIPIVDDKVEVPELVEKPANRKYPCKPCRHYYVNMPRGFTPNPNGLTWLGGKIHSARIDYSTLDEFLADVEKLMNFDLPKSFRYAYYVGVDYIILFGYKQGTIEGLVSRLYSPSVNSTAIHHILGIAV